MIDESHNGSSLNLRTISTYSRSSRMNDSCISSGTWLRSSCLAFPFPLSFGTAWFDTTREFKGARTKEVSAMKYCSSVHHNQREPLKEVCSTLTRPIPITVDVITLNYLCIDASRGNLGSGLVLGRVGEFRVLPLCILSARHLSRFFCR